VKALVLVVLAGCMMKSGGGSTTPTGGGPAGGETTTTTTTTTTTAGPDANGMVTMPNLVGKTEAEGAAMVKAAGFRLDMEHSQPVECGDSAPKEVGKINCQSIDAGTQVKATSLVQVNIYAGTHMEGTIVRGQLQPLVGLTVEQGKAQLAKLGYKGKVVIETPMHFIDKCGMNHICDVQPESGVSATDPEERLTFVVNKSDVKISTPDP
jgi:beta-lactam-binding protein with PASTA domain